MRRGSVATSAVAIRHAVLGAGNMSIIALKMTEFFFIGFHSHVQVVRASTESFVEDEDGAVVVGAKKERWVLAVNLT